MKKVIIFLIIFVIVPTFCQRGTFWGGVFGFLDGTRHNYNKPEPRIVHKVEGCETFSCMMGTAILGASVFVFMIVVMYMTDKNNYDQKEIARLKESYDRLKLFGYVNPESFDQNKIHE